MKFYSVWDVHKWIQTRPSKAVALAQVEEMRQEAIGKPYNQQSVEWLRIVEKYAKNKRK